MLGAIIGVGWHWTYVEFDMETIGTSDSEGSDAAYESESAKARRKALQVVTPPFMYNYGTSKPVLLRWL
ncbi:uncharacterized protein B0H18DRAFT_980114, partial [Fomitopsis serialis]|uniref:uncharacterized protein n=1 Tax=Fomitopsis serialis TaxID=139415 RepID=UPI002007C1B9